MTEQEWLASTDTEKMLDVLRLKGMGNLRKLRLFVIACRRRLLDLDTIRFNESPEPQEKYADDPEVPSTDDLTAAANEYAAKFALAAHFDPVRA